MSIWNILFNFHHRLFMLVGHAAKIRSTRRMCMRCTLRLWIRNFFSFLDAPDTLSAHLHERSAHIQKCVRKILNEEQQKICSYEL
jgi:hypothetical protein